MLGIRAGMCVVAQRRRIFLATDNHSSIMSQETEQNKTTHYKTVDYMYLIGGFAGWPEEDARWNGERARNDVWISKNGKDWTLILPPNKTTNTMPFVGRSWHSCITWHHPKDHSLPLHLTSSSYYDNADSNKISTESQQKEMWPRIYISGGGYIGTKGTNVVRTVEGYTDMWWSNDGSEWNKVNYEEGRRESLYSTNEWTEVITSSGKKYFGKWGHTMEIFLFQEDLNFDGHVSNTTDVIQFCNTAGQPFIKKDNDEKTIIQCKQASIKENEIPSMILIGGKASDGGPIVNDVFVSRPGVLCEMNGETCSSKGSCGPANVGCICHSPLFGGEYCEFTLPIKESGGIFICSCWKTSPLPIFIIFIFYLF